jgi:hypothetical protein
MKNYISAKIEAVTEYLTDLSASDLVAIHNEYCESQNYSDCQIYSNDKEFFETFFSGKVVDAVKAACYGEYNYGHDWVMFNGYGNLESTSSPDRWVDLPAIAADILENPENYYGIELEEVEER